MIWFDIIVVEADGHPPGLSYHKNLRLTLLRHHLGKIGGGLVAPIRVDKFYPDTMLTNLV